MSKYARRLGLPRRPTQVSDPAQMVYLRAEEGSRRQGFFGVLCAPSSAETGEVLIRNRTEDEYGEARWEERRAVRTSVVGSNLLPRGFLAVEGR